MKRTGLNIICSLLLAGGMCACTATPKQTEEIKWSGANVWLSRKCNVSLSLG